MDTNDFYEEDEPIESIRHSIKKGVWGFTTGTAASTTTTTITLKAIERLTVYVNPFHDQPWRFAWWLDDLGHRKLPDAVHRRLLGWLCDGLDRQF